MLKRAHHPRQYLLPTVRQRKKWEEPTFQPITNARSQACAGPCTVIQTTLPCCVRALACMAGLLMAAPHAAWFPACPLASYSEPLVVLVQNTADTLGGTNAAARAIELLSKRCAKEWLRCCVNVAEWHCNATHNYDCLSIQTLAGRRRPSEERNFDILYKTAAVHESRRQTRREEGLAAELQVPIRFASAASACKGHLAAQWGARM